MKYKLITLSEGTKAIPYIDVSPTALVILQSAGTVTAANIRLELKQWSATSDRGPITITDNPGGYTWTLLDSTYFDVQNVNVGVTPLPMSGKSKTWNTTTQVVPRLELTVGPTTWDPESLNGKSTKLIITNTLYGSRVVIPISYVNDRAGLIQA
jgi:hypothetical protein